MNTLIIEAGRSESEYWRDIWRYRELLIFLAWRDLLVRYKQTAVGVAWSLIRPFLTMAHNRLEYQHALRGIAYLRILAGERSPSTPIGSDRWGDREISDYPPIGEDDLEILKARIDELVRKAAERLE